MTTSKKATTGKAKGKKARLKASIRDLDAKRAAGHVKGGDTYLYPPKHIAGVKYEN